MDGCTDGWTNGSIDEWFGKRINGWMDGWEGGDGTIEGKRKRWTESKNGKSRMTDEEDGRMNG